MIVYITPKPEFFPQDHIRYGMFELIDNIPVTCVFENDISLLKIERMHSFESNGAWGGLVKYNEPLTNRDKLIIFTEESHPELFI